MPIVSKAILKSYFETGAPTGSEFVDLVDSSVRLEVGYGGAVDQHYLVLHTSAGGFLHDASGNVVILSEGEFVSGQLGPGEVYLATAQIGLGSGLPGESGFLAMSLELPGAVHPTTHYGFLELSVNGIGDVSAYAIEIAGFAFESVPDAPIVTSPIPEPGTGLLLMVGLALASVFARQRWRPKRAGSRQPSRPSRESIAVARPSPVG